MDESPEPIAPLHLLREDLCASGEQRRILQRAGFAVKVCQPLADDRWLPPGQGQLIVNISGRVRVQQRTAPTGAESLTPERDQHLQSGEFTRVPNDAHWCLSAATETARVLIISTSVARTPPEQLALTVLARTMRLRPQRQLFANQKLTVSLRALHPLMPLRRTLPKDLRLSAGSALVVLSGALEGQIVSGDGATKWKGELVTGSLLELPPKARQQLRAADLKTTALLIIEPRLVPTGDGKEVAFSPFVDG